MLYALLTVATIVILAQLLLLAYLVKRHQQTVDTLTSKILAPTLDNYTINKRAEVPIVEPKKAHKPAPPSPTLVPLSEADPEDVMAGLARQTGRMDEYGEE